MLDQAKGVVAGEDGDASEESAADTSEEKPWYEPERRSRRRRAN
jgi:hypothetical protein